MMKRTFIAIDIYPDKKLLQAVRIVRDHFLSDTIRWVRLDPAHITLAFLGDTDADQILLVKALLKERLSGFGTIDIEVCGAGFFGKLNDPKVLWFGISVNDKLAGLHNIVEGIVEEAGLVRDCRPFRPHITLGRVRKHSGITGVETLPENIRREPLMRTSVSEVVFYESILKPEGPVYLPLEKTNIAG
ncbi:MAG: RNA 2',3'-cyclic phosphodiesterase [Bacteroidales bacterium]